MTEPDRQDQPESEPEQESPVTPPVPSPPADTPSSGSESGSGASDIQAIADDRFRKLAPQWVPLERLGGGISTLVLSVVLLVPSLVASASLGGAWKLLPLPLWLGGVTALAVLRWQWPALSYRYTSYRLNERGIEIRRGVLFREVVTVPRSRVQHTDVTQGPLQRSFEVATLIIFTAGVEFAAVRLPGLEAATAAAIRDYLISGTGQDAV